MWDVRIMKFAESVNIYCFELKSLSRKPSRSNSTNPYSIRVYNFNDPNSS